MTPDNVQSGISVVIPCYFSEASIARVVGELVGLLPSVVPQYEIVLVNDGSTDSTWSTIERLVAENPHVKGVDLTRNFGQQNALMVGFRYASYPLILTMDDDGQHPPSEITKLVDSLTDNTDVVYGVPEAEQHGPFRNLASVSVKWLVEVVLKFPFAGDTSAFRLFRASLVRQFLDTSSPTVDVDAILCWSTRRVRACRVERREREFGKSNYTIRKLLLHTVNMMVSYSTLPLRVSSAVGFGFTLFGGLVLAHVVWNYLTYGGAVQGFTFLASTIAIFSGAQLFSIGVLGEYLGRVHHQAMGYPVAAVREVFDGESRG